MGLTSVTHMSGWPLLEPLFCQKPSTRGGWVGLELVRPYLTSVCSKGQPVPAATATDLSCPSVLLPQLQTRVTPFYTSEVLVFDLNAPLPSSPPPSLSPSSPQMLHP